ncbi:MAG: right-handed parallel beta-helix repeat-containing protein [Planctomycetota bacterium]
MTFPRHFSIPRLIAGWVTCLTLAASFAPLAWAQNDGDALSPTNATEALRPAGQVIRTVTPAPNPAIVLRNRTGITIRQLQIDDDVSVLLENCTDITIISCDLRSIQASGVTNLRIYNSRIHNSPNNAVTLDDCHDVVVQGNLIENVATGVYAHKSTAVQVVGNLGYDVQGPMPRGQLVQFDKVTGPGNLIMGNVGLNRHGRSTPEDMINLYQSVGTADSPIRIEHNHLSGDPDRGSQDLSASGSGIMLGDGGGQHQLCINNTLINPGQVGIGVAGGGDIQVIANTIVGTKSNVANVGLYTWNQYDAPAGDITVANNRVRWTNARGASNPFWNGDGFTNVTTQNNAFGDATLSADALAVDPTQTVPPIPHGTDPYYPFAVK